MATRNHTALFRKYRDVLRNVRPRSSATGRSGSIELTEAFGGPKGYALLHTEDVSDPARAGSVSVSLPPAWVDISEDVSSEMSNLKSKMADLAKSHGRALMVSFNDNVGEQQTIELLTADVTRSLKKCEQKLQRLSGGQGVSGDESLRRNVQRSLATDLQALSMEFRKLQKAYLGRLRIQDEGQSGPDLGMGFSQQRTRDEDEDYDDVGFSSTQITQQKQNEAMSAEREREITQIVESVNDLAQIMKDLSVLVIDQGWNVEAVPSLHPEHAIRDPDVSSDMLGIVLGTIVDRIDYNITNVAASVEQGVRELTKASETQKRGGMVLCVMILIVLCAFMLLVYIMKKIIFR